MTDPIADMLIRLENSQAVNKMTVDIPFSEIKYRIAKVLESENFVELVSQKGKDSQKIIRVNLKYKDDKPGIIKTKRISKPGKRTYIANKEIKPIRGGYGISVISTPKGVMSNKEAKSAGLGGEVLFEIY